MGLGTFVKNLFSTQKQPKVLVSDVLNGLPDPYLPFDDIIYNHTGIPHVLFNKTQGIFVINTVAVKGTALNRGDYLFINRKAHSEPIHKALRDTFWLKAMIRERIGIDVPIIPIAVFEHAKVKVTKPILGVAVIESKDLLAAILQAPRGVEIGDGVAVLLRELHAVHNT